MNAAPALSLGQFEYTETISAAIRAATNRLGNKGVARAANSNVRSVENWVQGVHAPNGLQLLRLMASVPEVQAEVRRLTLMEMDIDPEFERGLSELVAIVTRRRGGQ